MDDMRAKASSLLDAWGIDPESQDPIDAVARVGSILLDQLRVYAGACLALPSERLRDLPGGAARARAMSRGTWTVAVVDGVATWVDEVSDG